MGSRSGARETMKTKAWQARRWFLLAGGVFGSLIAAVLGVYGWAGYRYFWWRDMDRPGHFYALGKYGQYMYIAPDADAVVVRLGRDWGVGNVTWLATFRDVADQLEGRR